MKAAIYGAGDFGKSLLKMFHFLDIKIDCFVQSSRVGEMIYTEGFPVLTIEELLEEKEEYLIFIAINNVRVVSEILFFLRESDYNMSLVFDMRCFIKDNGSHRKNIRTGDKECLLCGNRMERFDATGERNEIFSRKKVIGGGYRENAICPCCGGMDRTRWVYWVIKKLTDMLERDCVVIHFAPEMGFRRILEENSKCDYYPVDICRSSGIHKIDVTNITYSDNMADFIIINHVMEHVKDEEKAVRELKRVLKENGKIIMSFPICTSQKTFEDDAIISEADREKYYGQKDHVRLYGTDYKERFERYGLTVQTFSPKDYMTDSEIEKYGLITDDIIMVCAKRME